MPFLQRLTLTLIFMILLTGCKAPFTDHRAAQQGQDPVTDISYKGPSHHVKHSSPNALYSGQFGYVHYKRQPGATQSVQHHDIPKIDPNELADIITRLAVSLPDIYEAGTLVTDHDILIGYSTVQKNRDQAASQVKMATQAIVPVFYHIYVSDAPNAISDIARYKNMTVHTPGVQKSIDFMISQMKKSPQGGPATPPRSGSAQRKLGFLPSTIAKAFT